MNSRRVVALHERQDTIPISNIEMMEIDPQVLALLNEIHRLGVGRMVQVNARTAEGRKLIADMAGTILKVKEATASGNEVKHLQGIIDDLDTLWKNQVVLH